MRPVLTRNKTTPALSLFFPYSQNINFMQLFKFNEIRISFPRLYLLNLLGFIVANYFCGNCVDIVRCNRKAKAFKSSNFKIVDSHYLAVCIDERPAGIARINWNVSLYVVYAVA